MTTSSTRSSCPVWGFAGTTITPGHPEYETARRVFNGMIDRRPALIARCRSRTDIRAVIAHARREELPLAVRGGGHAAPGFATCDDGVVIDLSDMKRVQVDPVARRARVQPGVLWGELDAATQAHGLAVTGGRVSTTGVVGLTIGSGSGWLERAFGYAADNLTGAEIVTADGTAVRCGPHERPDLFWALRGGGGNFGVVTELEFRLHPLGPQVLGGMMLFPFNRAADVITAYRDWIESCHDDRVCGGLSVLTAPPAPFVPDQMRGKPALAIVVLYAGALSHGAVAVDRLRALTRPTVDLVGPTSYTAVQSMLDEANPPGMRDYFKAGFLDALCDQVVERVIARAKGLLSPHTILILQPLGGAVAHVAEYATALGNRSARWAYQALSLWDDPDADEANIAWTRGVAEALAPFARPAGFPNFIAETGSVGVAEAYGGARKRLEQIKRLYDPDNTFRLNHNITPAGR